MRILKRNGQYEPVAFDKILRRISNLCNNKDLGVIADIECDIVSQKVIQQLSDGISSKELDDLAADIATAMSADNPGYDILASRIAVSNLHKSTPKLFSEAVEILYKENVVNKEFADIVSFHSEIINKQINHNRDYLFDFFGISTLQKGGYLLKVLSKGSKTIIERPQYMWMRVAIALHKEDLQKAFETYEQLSLKNFTHASPTLFNAGTKHQQLSSCFLISSDEDSVKGIFKTMGDVAQISKHGGGIGITIGNIRAQGSIIRGTNNRSDGIMPMLKVYNEVSRYINQGQRKGSIACFLETHHADIEIFLEMKKNTGDVNLRARDLFYGLWVSDLFMKSVEADDDWYLMCPDECPGLVEAYSTEYEKLYKSYVEKGMYRKKIRARELWDAILVSQIETGLPYMCAKDAVNTKSNQENIGTITSSNLCVAPETMILTSKGYYPIESLKDQEIEVWNGEKFSKTTIRQTGENQELIKVNLSGGNTIECTKYHKFYIEGETSYIRAQDLKNGMKIISSKFPVINWKNDMLEDPYREGSESLNTYTIPVSPVPINCNANDKLKWFCGLIESKRSIFQIDNGDIIICLSSISQKFLIDVKYLLQTMGCDSIVRYQKMYDGPTMFELLVDGHGTSVLFKDKNFLKRQIPRGRIEDPFEIENKVEGIEITGRISDTYCFNEPERNMGIFNGILTGNCVEIMLKHTDDEYAVCNISTICLGNCVKNGEFDYELLGKLARISVTNLNKVIDINFYPTPETEISNVSHRPIAIGVQGFYDALVKLRLPFTSQGAKEINKKIFECIQYNAIKASCDLAKSDGKYSSFDGSPSSKGMFQHNLWGIDESKLNYDWATLRKDVIKFGLRNSMLTALPPTASTANIMGNVSSFETVTSNIFTRSVIAGSFMIVNNYLVKDLQKIGMWSSDMKDQIILDDGSIQNIPGIPKELKDLYKTTWETSQKETINMSADRAPFIDHSQSLNIFMAIPTTAKLSSAHFHSWKRGLKTMSYYIRSLPSSTAEKITVSNKKKEAEVLACSIDNKDACTMCEG